MKRTLRVDVCDYENTVLCNLYDNHTKLPGAAVDVYVITERNGHKELTFTIPSVYATDEGVEENYRLQFLKADYRLRTIDDDETDYFLISEPKINHDHFSKNVDVRADHISSNLKNKNVDLEFSEEEGNNVGTASQLLNVILAGTGWIPGYVETFTEEDGSGVKQRSMSASSGTGALGLIQQMCELFDAAPVYHGGNRTVDIVSMNPFSKVDPGNIPPEVLEGNRNVIELHYDRNIKNIEKTENADNIITRLYCYGAYGDEVNGYLDIRTCSHYEYEMTSPISENTWYSFEDNDGVLHYFNVPNGFYSQNRLIWSTLDYTSQSYVWDSSDQVAYHVYSAPSGAATRLNVASVSAVKNKVPFITDFTYYDKIGLLSEEKFQHVAAFQQAIPSYYDAALTAAEAFTDKESKLEKIAESNTGFARLNVSNYTSQNGSVIIHLNNTVQTPDGVIYRSDYYEPERSYFTWHPAGDFKSNGEPVLNKGSIVFVIHPDNTWDKAYVTGIYDSHGNLYTNSSGEPGDYDYRMEDDYPSAIRVNATGWNTNADDRVYLFCTNSISGDLGTLFNENSTNEQSIRESLQDEKSLYHCLIFFAENEAMPSVTPASATYGWAYEYNREGYERGSFYFCWGERGDATWKLVHVGATAPQIEQGGPVYFYNSSTKVLYHIVDNDWVAYTSTSEKRLAESFDKAYHICLARDQVFMGLYEEYYRNISSTPLNAGRYAFENAYGNYWTFQTMENLVSGTLVYSRATHNITFEVGDTSRYVASANATPYDSVTRPKSNDLTAFRPGKINRATGIEEENGTGETTCICNKFKVYEHEPYVYKLNQSGYIAYYDSEGTFLSVEDFAASPVVDGSMQYSDPVYPPENAAYAQICCIANPTSTKSFRMQGYSSKIIKGNNVYRVYSPHGRGEILGINNLIKKFADLADEAYGTYLPAQRQAQQAITDEDNQLTNLLGEILRENKWQDSNYVQDQEQRFYSAAMDNLKELSHPETTYSFSFLDLYGSNHDMHYYEEHDDVEWPDIKITDAAHLVDPEIGENRWAYIDKINKCYDQEWKTTIEINTRLSLVGQHEFTDVLSRIAEVAKTFKGKQNIYDRAAILGNDYLPSDLLEGTIAMNQVTLTGGASSYYTDPNGNIIFESADGNGAMILSGMGLGVSNLKNEDGDWQYRSAITGSGITADVITTGYLSADRLRAGSITTNHLSSDVGQSLDISSNVSLNMFATIDGSKPSGALRTTDALIEIKIGQSGGEINVASGGKVNINGGTINITSTGALNLTSGGEFHLRSNNADTINSTNSGVYIGNDGINLGGGKFKASYTNGVLNVVMDANNIHMGSDPSVSSSGTLGGAIATAQTTAESKARTFHVTKTVIKQQTLFQVGDIWSDSDSTYGYKYVCIKPHDSSYSTNMTDTELFTYWQLVGTSKTAGAALNIDAAGGSMDFYTAVSMNFVSGGTINVAADSAITLSTLGTINLGANGRLFTIGSREASQEVSAATYIYYNRNTVDSTTTGLYLGTDGISVGKSSGNNFIATSTGDVSLTGTITANSGSIGGINIDSRYGIYTDSKTSATSDATGFLIKNDGSIYLGAYDSNNLSTPFQVTKQGYMTVRRGKVGGWNINDNYLSGTNVGMKAISEDDPNSTVAFWAGSAYSGRNTAAFRVQKDGTLYTTNIQASGGKIGAWFIDNDQYPGLLYHVDANNTNYVALDATDDVYPLSGETTGEYPYAMWAGDPWPNKAPFSVTRDGIVTAHTLRVCVGREGEGDDARDKYKNVDFSSVFALTQDPQAIFAKLASISKKDYKVISNVTVSGDTIQTITIYDGNGNGNTYNFNHAGSGTLLDEWVGNNTTYRVYINGYHDSTDPTKKKERVFYPTISGINDRISFVTRIDINEQTADIIGNAISMRLYEDVDNNVVRISTTDAHGTEGTTYASVSTQNTFEAGVRYGASAGWEDGWDDAYDCVSPPSATSTTGEVLTFDFGVPKSDRSGGETKTFTLAKGIPGTSGYASVLMGSTVVGRIDISNWYNDGWTVAYNSVTSKKWNNTYDYNPTTSQTNPYRYIRVATPNPTVNGNLVGHVYYLRDAADGSVGTGEDYQDYVDIRYGSAADAPVVAKFKHGRYSKGWKSGWDDAYDCVALPSTAASGEALTFNLGIPKSDRSGAETKTFTLSKDTPGTSGYASVSMGSTVVGRIDISNWYDDGWTAAYNEVGNSFVISAGTIKLAVPSSTVGYSTNKTAAVTIDTSADWSDGTKTIWAKVAGEQCISGSVSIPSKTAKEPTSDEWVNTQDDKWRTSITIGGVERLSVVKNFNFLRYAGSAAVDLSSTLVWATSPGENVTVTTNSVTVSTSGRTNSSGTTQERSLGISLRTSQSEWSNNKKYVYMHYANTTANTRIARVEVDGTGIHSDGWTAAYNSVTDKTFTVSGNIYDYTPTSAQDNLLSYIRVATPNETVGGSLVYRQYNLRQTAEDADIGENEDYQDYIDIRYGSAASAPVVARTKHGRYSKGFNAVTISSPTWGSQTGNASNTFTVSASRKTNGTARSVSETVTLSAGTWSGGLMPVYLKSGTNNTQKAMTSISIPEVTSCTLGSASSGTTYDITVGMGGSSKTSTVDCSKVYNLGSNDVTLEEEWSNTDTPTTTNKYTVSTVGRVNKNGTSANLSKSKTLVLTTRSDASGAPVDNNTVYLKLSSATTGTVVAKIKHDMYDRGMAYHYGNTHGLWKPATYANGWTVQIPNSTCTASEAWNGSGVQDALVYAWNYYANGNDGHGNTVKWYLPTEEQPAGKDHKGFWVPAAINSWSDPTSYVEWTAATTAYNNAYNRFPKQAGITYKSMTKQGTDFIFTFTHTNTTGQNPFGTMSAGTQKIVHFT